MMHAIVGFKNVENAPKNKIGQIIEHNTQTDHHAMALSGLTRLAAPESLLLFMESTPLYRRPFTTEVILYKAKKIQMCCCGTTAYESCFKSKNVFNVHKI
jgi:hypothetical protein